MNLEEQEAALLKICDLINKVNLELTRNHACLAQKDLNSAYSAIARARSVVTKAIACR